jgi:hypothetical protein
MYAEGCSSSGTLRSVKEDEDVSIREVELRVLIFFSASYRDRRMALECYVEVVKPVRRDS